MREYKKSMKAKPIVLHAIMLVTALPLTAQAQDSPAKYKDKNRVLLVFAPCDKDLRWQRQSAMLAGSRAQFADRDLVRLDVFAAGPKADPSLRARYRVKPSQFRVLLIGKDGHVAYGGPTPVSLHTLTATIDRMPMRRDEMRRKGEL